MVYFVAKFTFFFYLFEVHKSSLTPPLFLIEVPVPSQKSERAIICVLEVSTCHLCTVLTFDFGIVSTVW
jgi:hypothetical protein